MVDKKNKDPAINENALLGRDLSFASELDGGGANFPLVVRKALRRVIGNRIIILAHVSEDPQQSFALRRAAFAKATVLRRHEQRGEQTAVLFDEMMAEIAVAQSLQLPEKVGRQTASGQSLAQCLQFMRSDPFQESGP